MLEEINALNDALFKSLMVNANNREMVADVLSAITGIDNKELMNATYIGGAEIVKRKMIEKKKATDLAVLVNDKKILIVEMNQFYQENLFERNTSYVMEVLLHHIKTNEKVYPKVFLINIDNFNYYHTKKPILYFRNYEMEEKIIENEMYNSFHLVLENINNESYNIDEEIKKFVLFLKQTNIKDLENKFKESEKYMKAIDTVKGLISKPSFVREYTIEEKHKLEILGEKKLSFEEGYDDGAHQANIETAKNFLKMGVATIEQIASATGLSLQEVKNLKKELDG